LKLYYLPVDSFQKIYNYINKTESLIKPEDFILTNSAGEVHNYHNYHNYQSFLNFQSFHNPSSNDNKSFSICSIPQIRTPPYSSLICLGSFLNTNIYTFTRLQVSRESLTNLTNDFNNISKISNFLSPLNFTKNTINIKPKIKNLVKLIKYLTENFPQYSEEFFIYHIYSRSGLNSSRDGQLHIQLTEIKHQLNQKKFKNIDTIESNTKFNIGFKKTSINSMKSSNLSSKVFLRNLNSNCTSVQNKKGDNSNKQIINLNQVKTKSCLNSYRSMNTINTMNTSINHSKTVSIPMMNDLLKKANKINHTTKNVNLKIKKQDNNLRDSNELCNNFVSPVENKLRIDFRSQFDNMTISNNSTVREKDGLTTNSKIYVVSRDNNIRFKTDINISQDSSFDAEVSSENNMGKKTNITMSEECYNTPTKKKVIRYYS
jgi:hypothetical protein